jgi:hypothetical protein
LPSEQRENAQSPPVADESGEEVYGVDKILCARTAGRNRREALVKWRGYAAPEWTDVGHLGNVEQLDAWEAKWGRIHENNGPLDQNWPPGRKKARKEKKSG